MPISDFLACPKSELAEIMALENPWEHESWFKAKNIGMIELSQLGQMLKVGTYDDLSRQFNLIGEPTPDGPWPQSTPSSLMAKLAAITDQEIAEITPQWSQIEEFHGACPSGDLENYLKRLREFLRSNKGPYFLINGL